MASINSLKASDGTGNASVATVQSTRVAPATTIIVNTVSGIPPFFHGTMGTPHTFTDPVTSETITVISEATAVDFEGHVDGINLEIDTIAPGYTDAGSQVGDIVIIRPTTQWADAAAEVLEVSHNDDGTLKTNSVTTGNITDEDVTTAKLADASVTNTKLSTSAILLGSAQITATFDTTSATAVQVTDLTATVTVPAGGRMVKITAFTGALYNTTAGVNAVMTIWDGTVGSGTQLASCFGVSNSAATSNGMVVALVTPSAGSKTYNVGLNRGASGTARMQNSSTSPAFILVELI